MTPTPADCVFCAISRREAPATYVRAWDDAIAIVPLDPVTDGHVIVLPRLHVADFTDDPVTSALVMAHAAELARDWGPVNLITSKGREATQSVFHLHLHLVPRRENDGLALPWYSGHTRRTPTEEQRAVARIRELHQEYRSIHDEGDSRSCTHCNQITGYAVPWPCPTIEALGETR